MLNYIHKNPKYLIELKKERGNGYMKNLKKNQVVIYVIALMLVTAGYLSYSVNSKTVQVSSENTNTNIGDATFVSSNDVDNSTNEQLSEDEQENDANEENSDDEIDTSSYAEDEYFVTSKLERDRMYSQTIETYQNILDSSNSSEEQKATATEEITNINNTQSAIMICENLLELKGISNSVIFVNNDSVSVVVEAETLEQDLVAQIQNIITRELGVEVSNIHIMTK